MINSFTGRWSFLSNFYPCKIVHQGITYPSTEHYYVAMKVNDDQVINGQFYPKADVRELVARVSTPGQVKRFGSTLKLRKDWDNVKFEVMEWCLREKFKDEKLKEMLLQTGDEELKDVFGMAVTIVTTAKNKEEATEAMNKLNNSELDGRAIFVSEAKARE